ncbi:MAG: FdhF/YdeP family oxidoreductase, partial [Planctomycetia bacterium]
MPDCSNMCHESSGCALGESIGVGKGTVTLEDFEHADAIFVVGQNPGTNHPRMLSELENAHKRGAKIVSINPLREAGLLKFAHPKDPINMLTGGGTPISTHYYQVTVGGDLATLKGICKVVLEAEDAAPGTVLAHDFLKTQTVGFEEFAADARAADWAELTRESGLSEEQLREAAAVYLKAKSVIVCWAMGLTQHKHAVPTIQYVVNLLLLRGHFGRPGAGVCPVRGHSNVQGDRTMGITEKPKPEFLDGLRRAFNFEPPRHHGHDVVGAIHGMADGSCKVFIGMGGNFAHATPDTTFTEAALEKCDLTVHVSTKLNRSHLVCGAEALILPCLGRTEVDRQSAGPQRVSVEDSMSQVHASRGTNPPAGEHLKSEPAIVAGVAKATFGANGGGVDWDGLVADYSRIRDKIEETMPKLFHDYNKRLEVPGGFYLGNAVRDLVWNTKSGKAQFVTAAVPDLTLPPNQLRLMTVRSHDQYNTTVYDLNDRYRGVHGERHVVFLHPADAADRGLQDGSLVDLFSKYPGDPTERVARRFVVKLYNIPRGCAAAYFPETNVLVSRDSYADFSRTPLSKFIPIELEPSILATPIPARESAPAAVAEEVFDSGAMPAPARSALPS